MKYISLGSFLLLGFLVPTISVDAAQEDTKKVTFDIIDNPTGTLKVEADDLIFGDHTIVPGDILAKTRTNSSIRVTEFSGERPGWNLKVKMDKFTDSTTGAVADGVQLFYPKVTPTTTTGGAASSNAPTILAGENSFLESMTGKIVNDDNVLVKIASADVGKGYGQWELPYQDDERIQLNIPFGQRIGSYSAVLTYTIEESP